jgi:hypothetical protein
MAIQGPFVWFDWAIKKEADNTIKLGADSFKAVLCGSSQTISRSFVGSSADCRYSDLTGELATASGYTAGGVTLTTVALSRPSTTVAKWTADTISWTLTGSITFKYCIIYDNTNTNKDLLAFCDFDTTSTSTTITVSSATTIQIVPNASGILTITQP